MSKPELLPCPFCGGEPNIVPWHDRQEHTRWRMVSCDSETCVANPRLTGSTQSQAVKRWNTRISRPPNGTVPSGRSK